MPKHVTKKQFEHASAVQKFSRHRSPIIAKAQQRQLLLVQLQSFVFRTEVAGLGRRVTIGPQAPDDHANIEVLVHDVFSADEARQELREFIQKIRDGVVTLDPSFMRAASAGHASGRRRR